MSSGSKTNNSATLVNIVKDVGDSQLQVSNRRLESIHNATSLVGTNESFIDIAGNQFRSILLGDVHVLRTLTNSVEIETMEETFENYEGTRTPPGIGTSTPIHSKIKAICRVKAVKVMTGQPSGFPLASTYTAVMYEGSGAQAAYRNNLLLYSELFCNEHVAQLFAVTRSAFPMMVFHNELLPLSEIKCSPVGSAYLRYRQDVDIEQTIFDVASILPHSLRAGAVVGLWFQPQSGFMCIGPPDLHIQRDFNWASPRFRHFEPLLKASATSPIALQTYQNSVDVIKHIEEHISSFWEFMFP
ncbi:hypothetical protein BT96DRAFT_132718 [Gymnopus androsaceus JB14]|uniref:Uncharacterized protein n=1 Tax=Gymnopus androsaceus JB14 TaxID=1447944 RepID=A0A6A4IF58_9AGAR|nr:hypothetical protein BT96DRAFT_132718 [Gymnopus androsaceus JB14]